MCDQRLRFEVTITNTGRDTVWLGLDKPPARLDGLSFSYCANMRCTISSSVACGGDPMGFLRSEQATRLLTGDSATWRATLSPLNLQPGDARVSLTNRFDSARDLSATEAAHTEMRAEVLIRLQQRGRCFDVRAID
jgi:hypothetical protein